MKICMKIYVGVLMVCTLLISCEKNDPIAELGNTNNEFSSQLRVTYNNTRPLLGDTLIVSASTWQRDDKYKSVTLYETFIETFGLDITLKNGSRLLTKSADVSTLSIIDSIAKRDVLLKVETGEMDNYWVTASNNYVIQKAYLVLPKTGNYPNNVTLIEGLSDNDFNVLKGILAYAINRNDYLSLFPNAPTTDFTNGGTYVLSAAGINNLKTNLTRGVLVSIIDKIQKIGTYKLTIDVDAITPTNTTTSLTRTFDITP